MKYVYTATGEKLQARYGENNVLTYNGSVVRDGNSSLKYILTGEGRYVMNGVTGTAEYHLADHLGNVRVVLGSTGSVLQRNDYYPFGLLMAQEGSSTNRYLYNGKEEQELTGWLDYGARMYDAAMGRWSNTDPLSEKYLGITLYSYCLCNPINALDPDGKIVIFINGNHYGDGGASEYWRKYLTISSYVAGGLYGSIYKMELFAFDKAIMKHLNDNHAMYRDGALGGFVPFNLRGNMSVQKRIDAGYKQGETDVSSIISGLKRDKNGKIIETIKIITHSMGGAYGQGYAKAILDYLDRTGIEDIQIDFMAHFAPYQPNKLESQKHLKLGDLFQFSHKNDKWAGNEKIRGAIFMNTSNNKDKGHSIFDFLQYIQSLPQGKYVITNGQLVPQN